MLVNYFGFDKEQRKQLEKERTEKIKKDLIHYGDKKYKIIEMKRELKALNHEYATYPSNIYDDVRVQTSRNNNQIETAAISLIEKRDFLNLKIKEYERETSSIDFVLNSIDPLEAKIIKYRFVQGKSTEKVANAVGLSPSKVEYRIKKYCIT